MQRVSLEARFFLIRESAAPPVDGKRFFLLFRVGCAILCMLSNRIVHSVGYIGIDVPSFFLWNER